MEWGSKAILSEGFLPPPDDRGNSRLDQHRWKFGIWYVVYVYNERTHVQVKRDGNGRLQHNVTQSGMLC